jgi:type I restriction enzyme S subunit
LPGHWSCKPIKAVASCNDEVLGETTSPEYEIEYVEISDVEAGSGLKGSTSYAFGSAPSRARRRLKDGDVIVSTVRTYLRAIATVRVPPENLIASTGFAVIRPRDIETSYLGYAMQTEFVSLRQKIDGAPPGF